MRKPVPMPPPSQVEESIRTTPLRTCEKIFAKSPGTSVGEGEGDGDAVGDGLVAVADGEGLELTGVTVGVAGPPSACVGLSSGVSSCVAAKAPDPRSTTRAAAMATHFARLELRGNAKPQLGQDWACGSCPAPHLGQNPQPSLPDPLIACSP
jgi:hypothetical protein